MTNNELRKFLLLLSKTSSPPPPAWLPTDINGCKLWLRSDLGVTKDESNLVSAWADQSGDGNNATAFGSPLWKDNHLNGHPTIFFNGSTDYFLANLLATKGYFAGIDKPMTAFFVASHEQDLGLTDGRALLSVASDNVNGANFHALYFGTYAASWFSTRWDDAFNQKNLNPSWLQVNDPVLHTLKFSGTVLTYRTDGDVNTTDGDLDVGTAALDDSFAIGALYEGLGSWIAAYWLGDISEVIIFDNVISDINVDIAELYLSDRYNLHIFPESRYVDPTSIPGCLGWWRGDLGVTKDGSDRVSGWADQSDNGHNASQTTGDYQPLWEDNQANTHPTIQFNGLDEFLYCNGIAPHLAGNDTPYSLIVVARSIDGSYYTETILGVTDSAGTGAIDHYALFGSGALNRQRTDDAGTASNQGGTTSTGGAYKIYEFYFKSNALSTIKLNGSQEDSRVRDVGAITLDTGYIGRQEGNTWWAGRIAEIIIYDHALSTTEQTALRNALNTRYAIY